MASPLGGIDALPNKYPKGMEGRERKENEMEGSGLEERGKGNVPI